MASIPSAVVNSCVPKVGPFKPLAYKPLTPEIEKMYMLSFNATIERYRGLLSGLKADHLELPNQNFDVGEVTAAGKYRLADAAYAKLLHRLNGHYTDMPQDLRADLLAYYHDLGAPISTKTNSGDWDRVLQEVNQLKAVDLDISGQPVVPAADPKPQPH
jgi:trehalose/maltose hydrolase-like predicted phosphorylase